MRGKSRKYAVIIKCCGVYIYTNLPHGISFKDCLKNIKEGEFETQVQKIFLQYHATPNTTTALILAELLMKRKLAMRLSRVHREQQLRKYEKPIVVQGRHDQHAKQREFKKGDLGTC